MAKILIIDDSRFARLKLSDNLNDGGFEVIEAAHGEEGLTATREHKPDVIICDLLMPIMDGFTFLEKIKEEGIDTPVLVLTSDIQDKTREKAMNLGAVGIINKPPKYDLVIEQIKDLLKK